MAIMKNDIPILEYDADPLGVIMPDHEHININLPIEKVKGVRLLKWSALRWRPVLRCVVQSGENCSLQLTPLQMRSTTMNATGAMIPHLMRWSCV